MLRTRARRATAGDARRIKPAATTLAHRRRAASERPIDGCEPLFPTLTPTRQASGFRREFSPQTEAPILCM